MNIGSFSKGLPHKFGTMVYKGKQNFNLNNYRGKYIFKIANSNNLNKPNFELEI